ncbi:unnamed protein product [Bemisia tabaci]|uniref:Uncharacterized protein n=1 Tax=Bemisia tabaci TaxID=7038 RepID=A0A9N9ZZZ3_BEMTA|nr:unnamed protein product [Bemisia tabaci]
MSRSSDKCRIYGFPAKFSKNMLPTYAEVMRCYLKVRDSIKVNENNPMDPAFRKVANKVVKKLKKVWVKASLPIIGDDRICVMLKKCVEERKSLLKHVDRKSAKVEELKAQSAKKLFDICTCKCPSFKNCKCPSSKKVNVREQDFLTDQRTCRKMVISGKDAIVSKKLQKKEKRKLEREKSRRQKDTREYEANLDLSFESASSQRGTDPESDFEVKSRYQKKPKLDLKLLALTCDRTGVSDDKGALLGTASLKGAGLLTGKQKVFPSTLRRTRIAERNRLRTEELKDGRKIRGLYYDGRKDTTLFNEKKGDAFHQLRKKEDHYVLLEEPGSEYLGHVSPQSGKAQDIAFSIIDFLTKNGVSFEELQVLGCDSTNTNTGKHNGVNRKLEEQLRKALQWCVCQLHTNELPLQHLFEHVDGVQKNPITYSGPIGQQLLTCETLPIVEFEIVPVTFLPDIDFKKVPLSSDQKYLYEITLAVSTGVVPPGFENRQPGKLAKVRWMTTASRVLRLYIGTENPSAELLILVTFIMKVYSPMWFHIKFEYLCQNGALHIWRTITYSRYLEKSLKDIVDPVIQRGSYFAHPENILWTMLVDNDSNVRETAVNRILAAREEHRPGSIRKFTVPPLNFQAADYQELIDWNKVTITLPPILSHLTEEDLKALILHPVQKMTLFPCHTQAVERGVKLVTEASAAVCDAESRDGFIRARIFARKLDQPAIEPTDTCEAGTSSRS